MARLLVALMTLAVAGCATEDPRGTDPLRTDDLEDAQVVDAAPDAAVPDVGPDAAQLVLPPTRPVWAVVHAQDPAAGVRAALDPPQAPAGTAGLADHFDAVLVWWTRPGDAAGDVLAATEGPKTVIYDLAAREKAASLSDVENDVAWLAAHVAPEALQIEGRAVIGVVPGSAAAFARARAALAERSDAGWLVLVDEDLPEGPDIVAAMPQAAYGAPLSRDRSRVTPDDERARQRWAEAAAAEGVAWLPVASPPVNPRLDQADGAVMAPEPTAFARSLVLARRAASGPVIVDGIGAWRDDRQIDPVVGNATEAPAALTTGVRYAPYARERLQAVLDLLQGTAAAPVLTPYSLVVLADSPAVVFERLEAAEGTLAFALQRPAAVQVEVALSLVPFVVPEGAQLTYALGDVEGYVDVVFADGARLGPDGQLSTFAGQRAEEVVLVFPPGLARVAGTLSDLQVR